MDYEKVRADNARADRRYSQADWANVAQVSVKAVRARPEWSFDEWSAFGRTHLRKRRDQQALLALYLHTIDVTPPCGTRGGTGRCFSSMPGRQKSCPPSTMT
ncbi:MAG: hypothetical protein DLM56_13775 [Pseudonocardiales bacterium]|nr:MAG: hypothetical protein DLM56_13775 [Pseudonocardiales bacterium]